MALFKDWQATLAAYWLRKGLGAFWLASQGALKDEIEYRTRSAVKQRFPGYAASDALAALGAERQLEKPLGATDAQFAAKQLDAFARWYWGGTPFGLMRELAESFPGTLSTDYHLFIQTQQDAVINYLVSDTGDPTVDIGSYAPAADTPLPALGLSSPVRWNTFIVVIELLATHTWHGAVPNDASSFASGARRIIQRWRAQHAECTAIIIRDPSGGGVYQRLWGVWDPEAGIMASWADGGNWGDHAAGSSTTYWTPPSPQ